MTKKKASKRKRRAPLPQSKATNAYDLLEEVKAAIKEEPARYNQRIWLDQVSEGSGYLPAPACGTVACVAGWVVALRHPRLVRSNKLDSVVPDIAAKILGIDPDGGLFAGAILEGYTDGDNMPQPGTKAYVKLGIAHISRFQKEHKVQLKAKKLRRRAK